MENTLNEEFLRLVELVKSTPNDKELGTKVRELVMNSETKEVKDVPFQSIH